MSRQQYFVYELEGEAIEGAESSVGSPREGDCYRLTNADMFASWEPFHGALEISAVVGSDSNNGVSLVLAEAVFGGGGIHRADERPLPASVGALGGKRHEA